MTEFSSGGFQAGLTVVNVDGFPAVFAYRVELLDVHEALNAETPTDIHIDLVT